MGGGLFWDKDFYFLFNVLIYESRYGQKELMKKISTQPEAKIAHSERDIVERINIVEAALRKHIEEHESSRIETQNKIREVCDVLRTAVDNLERQLIDNLQHDYTEEESRLQESLERLGSLNDSEEMNNEEKGKTLIEVEGALSCIQKYKLNHPNFGDMKKWANDALFSEFKLGVSQSLSDEIKERIPLIIEVKETEPNEVQIDLEFLTKDENVSIKKMKKGIDVEYIAEMWNGEEGEDYEVRDEQVLGPSRKAYIEWRHRGGSECKVRVKAVWTELFGEKCESEWSEWKSFIIPKEHKNSGALKVGVVWDNVNIGETYTVTYKASNKPLYNGTKPYAIIPESVKGHRIQINGKRKNIIWKREMEIEQTSCTIKNLLEDLKLFHSDKDVCARVLKLIASAVECKSEIYYSSILNSFYQ